MKNRKTDLGRVEFALFSAKLPPPRRLRLRKRLHARLELIDLPPAMVKLLLDLLQPIRILRLRLLDAFVKIDLDLTEGFQPRDQIIVEYAEVGKRLCFRLPTLLL